MNSRNRARRWWTEQTPPSVRWAVYVSLPSGVASLGVGIYGDVNHWWDDLGFLTNIYSAFTSVLFGVPLALVVIFHLSLAQTEAASRKGARMFIQRSSESLVSSLEHLINLDEEFFLESCQHTDSDAERILSVRVGELLTSRDGAVQDIFQFIDWYRSGLNGLLRVDLGDLNREFESVKWQIEIFLTEARPRALEFEIPWIDPSDQQMFRDTLSRFPGREDVTFAFLDQPYFTREANLAMCSREFLKERVEGARKLVGLIANLYQLAPVMRRFAESVR